MQVEKAMKLLPAWRSLSLVPPPKILSAQVSIARIVAPNSPLIDLSDFVLCSTASKDHPYSAELRRDFMADDTLEWQRSLRKTLRVRALKLGAMIQDPGEGSDDDRWDPTFGCQYCGSCMERAKQGMPQKWEGCWWFSTNLSSLTAGIKSGCSECGMYVDAWNTFLRDTCYCLWKKELTLLVHVYHYIRIDRVGVYLGTGPPYEDLHAPQDHQTFLKIPRKPRYPINSTCLKLFRAEDHRSTRPGDIPSVDCADSLERLERYWYPLEEAASGQALDLLVDWIDECVHTHRACNNSAKKLLPKRILYLTDTHVYLQEEVEGQHKYVCLSHCWGLRGPPLRLTEETCKQLSTGVLEQDLPKVFSQAVQLCRKLSINYLWIDALCIRQDSQKDWEEAAASMSTIFENSYLTIAASWSSDSNGGLFSRKLSTCRPKKLKSANLYMRVVPNEMAGLILGDPSQSGIQLQAHWPLLTRAWVFQERQLSPRMVHFGENQLLWECQSGLDSEYRAKTSKDKSLFGWGKFLQSRSTDAVSTWHLVIQTYTSLNLSYETDRLPALAAIVERTIAQRKGAQYIAGMWTNSLVKDLAWRCAYSVWPQYYPNHPELAKLPRPRYANYVPSWSWASTQTRIQFQEYTPRVDLLVGLAYTPTGPASLGGVLDASLRLKGPVLATNIPKSTEDDEQQISPDFENVGIYLNMPDFDYSSDDRFKAPTIPVTLLIIGEQIGVEFMMRLVALVLYKSGDHWERIGLTFIGSLYDSSRQSERMQQFSASLPVEEVTII